MLKIFRLAKCNRLHYCFALQMHNNEYNLAEIGYYKIVMLQNVCKLKLNKLTCQKLNPTEL